MAASRFLYLRPGLVPRRIKIAGVGQAGNTVAARGICAANGRARKGDGSMIKIITKTPQELFYLGQRMAQLVEPGDLLALDGDLGAGKTLLTQGLADGLAVQEDVVSPTFTILHPYESGRLPLYHMDVYRLKQPEELYDLDYEEYFYGEGVTVVEWAQLVEPLLPEEYLGVEILRTEEGRELRFAPHGARYERLLEELTGCDYANYR